MMTQSTPSSRVRAGRDHQAWCDPEHCRGGDTHVSEAFVLSGQTPVLVEMHQGVGYPEPVVSILDSAEDGDQVSVPLSQVGPLAALLAHITTQVHAGAPLCPPGIQGES
jgi:hypothetical protein